MRILLTGGAGFIGSRVARQLVDRGHDVVALARPPSSKKISFHHSRLHIIETDVVDVESALMHRHDWHFDSCIHLAWYAEPGKYLDSHQNLDSLRATLILLKTLASARCPSIVMAGSCAEYESQARPFIESDPTRPTTVYAATKLAALRIAEQFCPLNHMNVAWGRVFLLYGLGEDERRAIPSLINALRGNRTFDASEGTQVRDFLNVDDVASAFVTLAESRAAGVFNVSSGEGRTMRAIFELVERLLDKQGAIRFGSLEPRAWEPSIIVGDNNRLKSLGWQPSIPLERGLETLVRHICSKPDDNTAQPI